MANPRQLDKRRKSIRSIRKITRTMELIATARFKKAMDRAAASTAYTDRITQLVKDLTQTGLEVSHPLLEPRSEVRNTRLLVLTANRGMCGGYNSNLIRAATQARKDLEEVSESCSLEVSGKRGISGLRFRGFSLDKEYLQFEDKPSYDEVNEIANSYLDEFLTGKLDRLDVVYTKFESVSRQYVVTETLLPLGAIEGVQDDQPQSSANVQYEFLPSPESILEEIVPTSFKVKLFKCFLDAAVSEQIARMVAMKSATENAGELIKQLGMQYNRARQGRITSELMDVIGGVEALK